MSQFSRQPGTITPNQIKAIHAICRKYRIDIDEVRESIGGSIKALSCKAASGLIENLGGGPLPNPPGQAPQEHHTRKPGVVRMITSQNVEQIERLLGEYFDDGDGRAMAWLKKDFKVSTVRELATTHRAGQVVHTFKTMVARRQPHEDRTDA
jgi:hypothetical protein